MSVYAQDYGYFFNSNNSDRKYNADSFEEWLKPFFVSGVFAGGLQVTAQDTPDMSVKVSAGYANLDGKAARWTESNTLALDTASGVYSRIDTIVLRRDNTNRAVSIEVVKGTASASPQPTAPTRNSDIYELVLAQILVGVGVTEIVASKITDKRMDSSVCGYVAATVTEIDFDQIKAQFDGWIADFEADTDEWFDAQADYFDDWFETIRGQLDEDAAGHLQNEVDDTQAMIADPYNQNTVYAAGDKCTHSGKLYEHASWGADTPAAEAWDPDHWTEIQVMDKMDAEATARAAADTALATEISTIQGEFGYIVDGKQCANAVAIGKYVIVRNSTIAGVANGLYTAKKAIPANTDLNDTYFTAVPNGGLNSLNDSIATLNSTKATITKNNVEEKGNITNKHANITVNTVLVTRIEKISGFVCTFSVTGSIAAEQTLFVGLPVSATNRAAILGYRNASSTPVPFFITTSGGLINGEALSNGDSIRIATTYISS